MLTGSSDTVQGYIQVDHGDIFFHIEQYCFVFSRYIENREIAVVCCRFIGPRPAMFLGCTIFSVGTALTYFTIEQVGQFITVRLQTPQFNDLVLFAILKSGSHMPILNVQ